MPIIFFSYSHRDEALRDEMEVHFVPLKREGLIESWHDRRIDAGDDFHGKISAQLERADVILLLVSPYFLASDYCYDVELRHAMERHASGAARVIPVILESCDWHSAPFGKLLALPTDGKPISKFTNQHDALLEVAQAVRKLVEPKQATLSGGRSTSFPAVDPAAIRSDIRSSNLRVKKQFTDHDKDAFLDEVYEYLANFFEGSLQELCKRSPEITYRYKRVDGNRFTVVVYRSGESVGECAVTLRGAFGSGITYSSDSTRTDSYNESLSVGHDGHSLFIKAGFSSLSDDSRRQLSAEGAAELLWALLIRPLQQ